MYSKFGQFIDGKWQISASKETYEKEMVGGKFEKTTWNIPIYNEKGQQVALMRTGSNTTGTGNNTYEMKKAGAATAMLGKVDKGLLLSRLKQDGIKRKDLPTYHEMRNLRPKNKGDSNYLHWQKGY